MAAPINYGYRSQQRSGGGFHLSGTTSLSGTTLIALAKDVVFGLILHGARKIVLMNGHYENYQSSSKAPSWRWRKRARTASAT